MKNYITKILAANGQARILFAENTDLIHEICCNQKTNKLVKTLLARTVSCASLLTGLVKDNHRISLKVNASQRDYRVYADVDAGGNVRGFASDELLGAFRENFTHTFEEGKSSLEKAASSFAEETSSLTIEQLIGDRGYIQVTNDIGMNSIMTGITDMPYGNIVDDISHYYTQSEQTPTWISTYMIFNEQHEIELSRAVLVQLLPGAPAVLLQQIREIITKRQKLFLDTVNKQTANKEAMKELPFTLFHDAELLETRPLQRFCGCSKEMFFSMLYALGNDEVAHAYHNGDAIEFACNMCGTKYAFQPEELKPML